MANTFWDNIETVISDRTVGYSLNEIDGSENEMRAIKIRYLKKEHISCRERSNRYGFM